MHLSKLLSINSPEIPEIAAELSDIWFGHQTPYYGIVFFNLFTMPIFTTIPSDAFFPIPLDPTLTEFSFLMTLHTFSRD